MTVDLEYDNINCIVGPSEYVIKNTFSLKSFNINSVSINLFGNDYLINGEQIQEEDDNIKSFTPHIIRRGDAYVRGGTLTFTSDGNIKCEYEFEDAQVEIKPEGKLTLHGVGVLGISSDEALKVSFDCDGLLFDNEIPVQTIELSANQGLSIIAESEYVEYSLSYDELSSAKMLYISTFEAVGKGTVSYFNTANVKNYELLHQTVSCDADVVKHDFAVVTVSEGNMHFVGPVKNAKIMGRSIIPSAMAWIADNMYVIPTVLITIIGGAITLSTSSIKWIRDGK